MSVFVFLSLCLCVSVPPLCLSLCFCLTFVSISVFLSLCLYVSVSPLCLSMCFCVSVSPLCLSLRFCLSSSSKLLGGPKYLGDCWEAVWAVERIKETGQFASPLNASLRLSLPLDTDSYRVPWPGAFVATRQAGA